MSVETVPIEEPVEVWQPEENTIYIIEEPDEIIFYRECFTAEEFALTSRAVQQTCALHNRDYATYWRMASGQCTLEDI